MFRVGEVDVRELDQFGNMLGALGQDGPKVITRALNRTGDMARTRVVRELAKQTGLPQKTIRKAVKVKRASWGDLEYSLTSSGGNIDLRYFNTRETRRGVVAFLGAARGKQLFEGAFMRGGQWPKRVPLSIGAGGVFQRVGRKRLPIERIKSDVFIPIEMVEGETAKAFEDVVADVLPRRLSHEINRSLGL